MTAPPQPPASPRWPAPPEDDRPSGATPYRHGPARSDLSTPPPLPAPTYQRRHRGWRLAGLAAVGLLVAAGAASTVPEMVRDTQEEVFALPAGTIELDLRGDAGDIVLREAGPGREPGIVAEKHWSFREPTVEVSAAGGVTSASLDCPSLAQLGQCYASWTVTVPEGLKVVVRANVGDVDVAGLTGEVTVQGSVGDVQVSGAPSTLDVSTSVGSIDAALSEPASSVRLRSSVGDVDLRLPGDVAYDVQASSSLDAATVDVETSSDSDYEVDVETSVGSVSVTEG
jgi:hypothetical protein